MIEGFDNTRRKWVSQMSDTEIKVLTETVTKYNKWSLSNHARREMQKDSIQPVEVASTIKRGKVMEIHNCNPRDVVVVFRHIINFRSLAVALSLVSGQVVTVFANTIVDGDRTPNMDNYRWEVSAESVKRIGVTNLVKLTA